MVELIFILLIIVTLSYHCNKKKKLIPSSDFDFANSIVKLSSVTSEPSVILKEPTFDISKIKEYKGVILKKFEFRPQTFKQFIGQEEAKSRANTIIKKAKSGMKAHILVDGIQGHGKTTFVEILAKSLSAKLIKRIGRQVVDEELVTIINEINTSPEDYVMFFIDEIDTMKWKVLKSLNPIIESFEIGGKNIKPFVFACATINKHKLITTNPDTLDRIPHHLKFQRYNDEEIKSILKLNKEQLYPDNEVPENTLDIISKNCKFNPRISIGLLGDFIIEQDIKKVFRNNKIIIDGLTQIDIKVLQVLNNSKRAIGSNALAMRVKLSEKEYTTEYEPFLVSYDYIERIPSRIISNKGKEILLYIKNENKI